MPTIKSWDVTKACLEDCFAKLELSLFFHFILAVILSHKISKGINTYRYYSLLNLTCFLTVGVGSSYCLLTLSLWMVLCASMAVMWSWGMCFKKSLFVIPIVMGFFPQSQILSCCFQYFWPSFPVGMRCPFFLMCKSTSGHWRQKLFAFENDHLKQLFFFFFCLF